MRFPVSCPIHIVMIGCGGTGGHIAPYLYRLLYSVFRPSTVILCDGDIVEKKNLVRQNFVACDLGRNKAEVLAERYSAAFGMECSYVPDYPISVAYRKAMRGGRAGCRLPTRRSERNVWLVKMEKQGICPAFPPYCWEVC